MKRRVIIIGIALCIVAVVVLGSLLHSRKDDPKHAAANATLPPASTQPTQPTFDKHQYSLTDPKSPWVIVNKQHPLKPKDYVPADLTDVGSGQQMRAEAAAALKHMFADAQTAGFTLVPDSAYRSYTTQVSTYGSIVSGYGQAYADTVSARPGFSEHQTGWAVDIGTGACHVADCFGDTAGGKWAAANAYKYGFILRYPDSLTSITGYSHEAWHFRYVGPVLSTRLHQQNVLTLEQFFGVAGGTTYVSAP